jgi:hypothetical protein
MIFNGKNILVLCEEIVKLHNRTTKKMGWTPLGKTDAIKCSNADHKFAIVLAE